MNRFVSVVALIVGVLCCAALGAQTVHTVEAQDNQFDPEDITICLGDILNWDFVGNNPHSSTSGDACDDDNRGLLWDSGVLNTGATFTRTFDVPDECPDDDTPGDNACSYFCSVHCNAMLGSVTVAEQASGELSIATNKLRVAKGGDGRGGTMKGIQTLTDHNTADIDFSSRTVTLFIDAGGQVEMDMVNASDTRQRFNTTGTQAVEIGTVVLQENKDGDIKVTVKYETNGLDLSGPVTSTLVIDHVVDTECGGLVSTDFSGQVTK